MTTLRHGLREEQFRRYEPAIAEIVKQWPRPSFHRPEPPVRSLETLRARLRDAMLSLQQNRWATTIDLPKFLALMDDCQVVIDYDREHVIVSPRGTRTASTASTPTSSGLVVATNEESVIMSILTLHHHGIFLVPTTIETTLNVLAYVDGLDVSVQETKKGLFTIL